MILHYAKLVKLPLARDAHLALRVSHTTLNINTHAHTRRHGSMANLAQRSAAGVRVHNLFSLIFIMQIMHWLSVFVCENQVSGGGCGVVVGSFSWVIILYSM